MLNDIYIVGSMGGQDVKRDIRLLSPEAFSRAHEGVVTAIDYCLVGQENTFGKYYRDINLRLTIIS